MRVRNKFRVVESNITPRPTATEALRRVKACEEGCLLTENLEEMQQTLNTVWAMLGKLTYIPSTLKAKLVRRVGRADNDICDALYLLEDLDDSDPDVRVTLYNALHRDACRAGANPPIGVDRCPC